MPCEDLPLHAKDKFGHVKPKWLKSKTNHRLVKFIQAFLKRKDYPNWYRGLSVFQTNAGIKLHSNLRDDFEQNSTHRVRLTIFEIGLNPIYPTDEDLRMLITISHAHDLAFLWFLWEWFYKSHEDVPYTVNEQIILTTIANLDVHATIRELDRILPPAQPTKAEIRRRKRLAAEQKRRLRERKEQLLRKSREKNLLPYFHKLEIPEPYGKPLVIAKPGYRVNLDIFDRCLDPDFIIPNETNRWFANYKFNPGRRIVRRILEKDLLGSEESLEVSTMELMKPVVRKTIGRVFSVHGVSSGICARHKREQEEERHKEIERWVERRNACLALCDTEKHRKELRKRRILTILQRDIEEFVKKYQKKLASSCRDCLAEVLSDKFICAIHLIDEKCEDGHVKKCGQCKKHVGEEEGEGEGEGEDEGCGEDSSLMDGDMLIEKYSSGQKICYEHREPGLNDYDGDYRCEPTSSTSDDLPKGGGFCKIHRKSKLDPVNYTKHLGALTDSDMYNFGHNDRDSACPSKLFFEATTEHKPFHMKYGRIFCFQDEESDTGTNIKKYAVEALGGTVEHCKTLQDSPPKVDQTIAKYVTKTFKEGAAVKRIEMEEEEERQRALQSIGNDKLKFDRDYFDPDDRQLMIRMIKTAFIQMRKDPKFVLVTLPKSYMLPIIVEWVSYRFGKVYSEKELKRELLISLRLFSSMGKLTPGPIRAPTFHELGYNQFVRYNCRTYLLKKGALIRGRYFKRVIKTLMEQSRVYFYIMQQFLCTTGPPHKTFFAYCPPREADFNIFRSWRGTEYRNVKLMRSLLAFKAQQLAKSQ